MSANCPVQPTCPESSRVCSPVCKSGFSCTLNVIDAPCQCPIASCTKVTFDTGDSGTTQPDSSGSIVGPIVGGIAGLAVVAAIVVLVIRRKRKRHHLRKTMVDPDDSIESFSKRWTIPGDRSSTRSPFVISLIDDSPNKHDSVASHMSGILDEAVVMDVTAKATPQVMKLHTIKQTNTELIQRSNTLHTSNSIKRSNSRNVASVKLNSKGGYSRNRQQQNPSPLGAQSDDDDDSNDDTENKDNNDSHERPLSTMSDNNPFLSIEERSKSADDCSISTRNPFESPRETEFSSVSLSSTTARGSTIIPDSRQSLEYSPFHPPARLTPWANDGPSRDSTLSTASDARSSTRGDGEEIMIFWGGSHTNRNSKASDM
ncbi:hypothetical protein BG006_009757 [Podila minutissima]|uniref:Uncharacterized protein n=1 Tax=Podila minutissima TaxID=64525 RepID=A0A9P5VJ75_9FUNG|nr:hypothetical protein BG006_009757 [Podila minutissima]